MALTAKLQADLRRLREEGLSVREISKRTSVPSATVHRHVRGVEVNGHHPASLGVEAHKKDGGGQGERQQRNSRQQRDHGFPKVPGRYIDIARGRRYHGLLIHLPDSVICPECEDESDDIVLCLDCGVIWMGECGHGGEIGNDQHRGVNLAELPRGKGNGELHVLPLTFQG